MIDKIGDYMGEKFNLIITVKDDGGIHVSGPINDKIFCLGLIEVAKKIIIDFDPSKQKSMIVPIYPPISN